MIVELGDLTDAKILIVDDQRTNVVLLEKILKTWGFEEVTSTIDPRETTALVTSFEPDILLLDLQMPHVDGFEVMGSVRELPQTATMPILVLTADATVASKRKALASGANDFLVKPFDATEVILRIKNLLQTRFLQLKLQSHNELLEDRVKERTAELWSSVTRLEQAENLLKLSQEETVRRLSIAAEFRDDETAKHIVRMSHYCSFLAERAGFDYATTRDIRVASQMHDVGKIATPDAILLKPTSLTDEERLIMQRHPEDGWRILHGSESPVLQLAAEIAYTHHERLDGTGYPRRLRGDDIPLVGRIAAIADVFDALSTHRVYRRAFPLPEVWRMMREGRGTHLDPDLLDVFLDAMDDVIEMKNAHEDELAS
ncbi:MAG TPA: HD domain-containing phosphohydrolase [Actinomycetota bacterium]|nr:HD domain-containing phosphohydrolase [Actinomycetota bacterium]